MIELTDAEGKARSIPIDKVALSFTDPETGKPVTVPVTQIVVGGMDYATINKYPFVYDRKNGYISIRGEADVFMRKLDPEQIKLIEDVLKIKASSEQEGEKTQNPEEKIEVSSALQMKK